MKTTFQPPYATMGPVPGHDQEPSEPPDTKEDRDAEDGVLPIDGVLPSDDD